MSNKIGKLTPDNEIIHGLWIGSQLSAIELLTLHSFTRHAHLFHLWVYGNLENELPEGVLLHDANEIILSSVIFKKKESDPKSNIGKGSYGTFSDLFRYKLLYEKGGWWVDMDITCLKPFNFDQIYFFRKHPILDMIGNVMKCPKGSELMKATYEEAFAKCGEHTEEWLLTNKILNKHVKNLGLEKFIFQDYSNRDWWREIEYFIYGHRAIPSGWYFIHWLNEEWRRKKLNKSIFYKKSSLGKLMAEYGIPVKHTTAIFRARMNWLVRLLTRKIMLSLWQFRAYIKLDSKINLSFGRKQ